MFMIYTHFGIKLILTDNWTQGSKCAVKVPWETPQLKAIFLANCDINTEYIFCLHISHKPGERFL